VEYVHAGYASKYERYLMIKIAAGKVTNTRIIGLEAHEKEGKELWAKQEKALEKKKEELREEFGCNRRWVGKRWWEIWR